VTAIRIFRHDGGPCELTIIHEGGFDEGGSKSPSFETGIRSRNDPGRLAEGEFQMISANMLGNEEWLEQKAVIRDTNYEALEIDVYA
jgi:hypothetical protein